MSWRLSFIGISVLAFLGACSRSPSYLAFVGRERGFYEKIADGCSELHTTAPPALVDGSRIPPDRISLPAAIRDLHPDYLRLTTNRVFISIGVGRGSYGVAWQPGGSSSWELRTYAENLERVLLTRMY